MTVFDLSKPPNVVSFQGKRDRFCCFGQVKHCHFRANDSDFGGKHCYFKSNEIDLECFVQVKHCYFRANEADLEWFGQVKYCHFKANETDFGDLDKWFWWFGQVKHWHFRANDSDFGDLDSDFFFVLWTSQTLSLWLGYAMAVPWLRFGYALATHWTRLGYALSWPRLDHGSTVTRLWLGYDVPTPWLCLDYTLPSLRPRCTFLMISPDYAWYRSGPVQRSSFLCTPQKELEASPEKQFSFPQKLEVPWYRWLHGPVPMLL